MSCLYRRIGMTRKLKCVVLFGEVHKTSSSATATCCTDHYHCEQPKTSIRDLKNGATFPSSEHKPFILVVPRQFHSQSANKQCCRKTPGVTVQMNADLKATDTKCDHVHLYKRLQLCKTCLFQQLPLISTATLQTCIMPENSCTCMLSILARHKSHSKHACVKHWPQHVFKNHFCDLLFSRHSLTNSLLARHAWHTAVVPVRRFTKTVEVKEEQVVTPLDIQKFLAASGMKFEQGYTCFISSCPKISKLKGKDSNKQKLYINMTTGHFLCEHCDRLGGWQELMDNVLLLGKHKRKKDYECFKDVDSVQKLDLDSRQVGDLWMRGKPVADLSDDDFNKLVDDFNCEKLTVSTMNKYRVRYDMTSLSLLFPVYNRQCSVAGMKRLLLKISDDEVIKTTKDVLPRSGPIGLFGWNTISPDITTVVMTTSMIDAMTVYQEIKVHAVALPKGFSVLPQELLPSLEQFKKIILWFGDDIRAWEAAKQFAKKLGNKRCFVIRPSSDDPSPYKALCKGQRLKSILDKAKPIGHKSIVSFSQLRQEIFSELAHVEQVAGVKWKRFPALNRILKGHRRGELTVFTGPTGSGKTTFISDYSLDLCTQGVNTLWGSFEINNVRLGKMMLTQFARLNLSKHLNQFDKWANLFEDLPMYFMTFHGQENIRNVVETMSHAVYVHDIVHVVVDNLQFMMGTNEEYVDKFTKQDMIVSAFRKFATKMNCHVTLVIHPRKEKEADDLTTASIFGSAKASQEADNVLILQDKRLQSLRGNKYLQITKNRFDGELGVMLLKFDKDAKGFYSKDKLSKREESEKQEEKKEEKTSGEVKQEVQIKDIGDEWFTKT